MAASRMTYNAGTPGGAAVLKVIDDLIVDQAMIARVVSDMATLINGADYTAIEAAFGLVAGTGLAFYTAINDLKANLMAAINTEVVNLDRVV